LRCCSSDAVDLSHHRDASNDLSFLWAKGECRGPDRIGREEVHRNVVDVPAIVADTDLHDPCDDHPAGGEVGRDAEDELDEVGARVAVIERQIAVDADVAVVRAHEVAEAVLLAGGPRVQDRLRDPWSNEAVNLLLVGVGAQVCVERLDCCGLALLADRLSGLLGELLTALQRRQLDLRGGKQRFKTS
jgi:hypothetical protein